MRPAPGLTLGPKDEMLLRSSMITHGQANALHSKCSLFISILNPILLLTSPSFFFDPKNSSRVGALK